jgi:hypothetical protein
MGVLDRRAREHNATAILAFLDDPQVNSEDARSYIRARAEEVRTSTDRRHLESSYPKMVREAALEASERRRTQRSSLGLPTPEEEAVYEPVVR